MRDDFAVFICTHGRPDKQLTLDYLLSAGYTGKYYLVLDDQDETIQQYIDNYGPEHLLVFDKNHYINTTEVGSNNPPFKCIVYAKNAVEDIARDMNLSAFMVSDDDNLKLRYRYPEKDKLKTLDVKHNLDSVFEAYIDVMLESHMTATAFGFAQFYFAGSGSFSPERFQKLRVPYNMVFRNASIPIKWKSAFGEDIVTALMYEKTGQFWTALPYVQIETEPVGKAVSGGMASTYQSMNSMKLAMYDFMFLPTATRPYYYKGKFMASIKREQAFPKLISSSYRKE